MDFDSPEESASFDPPYEIIITGNTAPFPI